MNKLSSQPSLYLRQHAHNPVHWQPWGQEAWAEARERNCPVIVSIGYSSCHWCHVMERECFEDEAVAALMNGDYVCIKVDREERPDVDMIYMEAVQQMGLQGGWPLNAFCTPEGKPFYGGTYFPPRNWQQVLSEVARAWREQPEQILESAEAFAKALAARDAALPAAEAELATLLSQGLAGLLSHVDAEHGGIGQAPKFPLPGMYALLVRMGHKQPAALAVARKALSNMAYGGLYDHVGGGFCRYSTDAAWFAPHFEKMLYDNGQLLSAYAQAYAATLDIHYRDVALETVGWLQRAMRDGSGAFYGSLDADSEGHEGWFYTWPAEELKTVLGADFEVFSQLYGITQVGNWESGRNIIARHRSKEELAAELGIGETQIHRLDLRCKRQLLLARQSRPKPGRDKKIVTCWQGLVGNGLVDCYRYLNDGPSLQMALECAEYVEDNLLESDRLLHQPDQAVEGFLDDYAAMALFFINLYEATFSHKWLGHAEALVLRCLTQFADGEEPLLFYTSQGAETLIARKKEVHDSVIPSSNAMLGLALLRLSHLLARPELAERARQMLDTQAGHLGRNLRYFTTWAEVARQVAAPMVEISILGPNLNLWREQIDSLPLPAKVLAGSAQPAGWGMLAGKTLPDERTAIYICREGACLPPVFTIEEVQGVLMG